MTTDFLDLEIDSMYFEGVMNEEAKRLIEKASMCYGSIEAERCLLKAYLIDSDNLMVHVALYRYYYYQHRLEDAIRIVNRLLSSTSKKLGITENWKKLTVSIVEKAAKRSVSLLRYHLLALKALAFVKVRTGKIDEGISMMNKVVELDPKDYLKTRDLLNIIVAHENENVIRI